MANDLLFQNISTVQSNEQPTPTRLASTTTIAPNTFMTFVSGTTNIATLTPPVTGAHMLVLIPTDASPGQLVTTGNIKTAITTLAQNRPQVLYYDPVSAKYWT